jgi:rhodanese-related sulfurtransferase
MNPKNLMISLFLGALIIGVLLTSACIQTETNTTKSETQIQIIKNITPEGAYILIKENKDNPNFTILDVRTPEEFLGEYIENAVNLDYYSDTFRNDLDKLDKNKTYLIYCRSGRRSENALNIMKELDFREVYNMLAGIIKWKSEGLPTTK